MEVVHSKGSEELKQAIERREIEKAFYARSDHLVSEEEQTKNKKYENLNIVENKYERRRIYQRILNRK